ncbi:hypothetical protein Tco_0319150 [Tanacetum coccineum]
MMMSHGGELLACYRGLNQSHHEYILSIDSMLKGYEEKVASLTRLELQSKDKGKERKKKIKSLTKSLDNLHSEVARLSAALNQHIILEAKRGEEILWIGTTGFERGLSMHRTKDEFAAVLKKMLEPEKLARPANVPTPRDTRASPPIAKELTVTPVSKSLELSINVVPASSGVASEQNEEQVYATVYGSDLEMADSVVPSKSGGVFVQGVSCILDDVIEVVALESERVSSSPTNFVVALSVDGKCDVLIPSFVAGEQAVINSFGV